MNCLMNKRKYKYMNVGYTVGSLIIYYIVF